MVYFIKQLFLVKIKTRLRKIRTVLSISKRKLVSNSNCKKIRDNLVKRIKAFLIINKI